MRAPSSIACLRLLHPQLRELKERDSHLLTRVQEVVVVETEVAQELEAAPVMEDTQLKREEEQQAQRLTRVVKMQRERLITLLKPGIIEQSKWL